MIPMAHGGLQNRSDSTRGIVSLRSSSSIFFLLGNDYRVST
jgi:hypothetical protein